MGALISNYFLIYAGVEIAIPLSDRAPDLY